MIRKNKTIVQIDNDLYISARVLIQFHKARIAEYKRILEEYDQDEEASLILNHEVNTLDALRAVILNF